jgi:hypothetical protein
MNTLYRIYYNCGLMYLGRTCQPLNRRLHGHFHKKPMHRDIDPRNVSKIEYAELSTVADMYLYEVYYINMLHPPLNCDDKARDNLTVSLPELDWKEHWPHLMDKWKEDAERMDQQEIARRQKVLDDWQTAHDLRVSRRAAMEEPNAK